MAATHAPVCSAEAKMGYVEFDVHLLGAVSRHFIRPPRRIFGNLGMENVT
jgi:hypothetical protein